MKRRQGMLAGAVFCAAAIPVFAQEAQQTEVFTAVLHPVNNSGVRAVATMAITGNQLTVIMAADGLETGINHPAHIHVRMQNGDQQAQSSCPTLADDQDGNNLLGLEETQQVAGAPLQELSSNLVPTGEGNLEFSQTYQLPPEALTSLAQSSATVVIHGLTVQGQAQPTLPVACGRIHTVDGVADQDSGQPLG